MTKKAEIIGSHFPTIYLTVISLLQGIALSQLVPNLISFFELSKSPLTDLRILPLLLMLFVIFIVWHHYAIGIFFLRWFPNIIDTILPFLISLGQFILISLITIDTAIQDMNVTSWTMGFAAFVLLGSLAYFSAAWRLDPPLFNNLMSLENAEEHCRRAKNFYMWAGISILFQGLYGFLIVLVGQPALLLGSLIFFILHLILSEYFQLHNLKPHFMRAMDEFDEIV
ncbi:MAG: hypothetical protein M3R25_09005 [Bacteroidota bacterium]|nr:hypothetical protein [Bacteroidota bacterium]